ncbi:MAG: class I tRNA ligase family protein [Deltaproteobacteria bacterium]|nr:class I tRNA ligase family protein [Deltaproteobacteria bacterium]
MLLLPMSWFKNMGRRLFELFIGPPEQESEWNDNGIEGVHKFLKRAWMWFFEAKETIVLSQEPHPLLEREHHKLIKKVTERMESFKFNTIISAFMEFMNEVSRYNYKETCVSIELLADFLILLSPLAPHMAEELWAELGHKDSIFKTKWPVYDPQWIETTTVTLVVQVNGKLRANIEVDKTLSESQIKEEVHRHPTIQKYLEGKELVKEIYVPGKLINLVIK